MKSILLVDDSEDDAFLMKRAIDLAHINCDLTILNDGEKAVQYLSRIPKDNPPVELVLLDLKMPRMDGHEVLTWIRKQPALNTTPVVMLTSSNMDGDKAQAYNLGANSYLVKPGRCEELNAMVQSLSKYWLEYNHTLTW
jgi:CheY-like chemotaxis protein